MRKKSGCKAYRCGDQMHCSCGLQWDIDDPDRPQCARMPTRNKATGRAAVDGIRELLQPKIDKRPKL